jgi:hypothetical protein
VVRLLAQEAHNDLKYVSVHEFPKKIFFFRALSLGGFMFIFFGDLNVVFHGFRKRGV